MEAGTSCGPSGYAYAGIQPAQTGYGISVRLASLASPIVQSGHVAGWIGVGGPGQGPGGTDEWLQVGLNSLPGTPNKLYYEVMQPGAGQTYAELNTDVPNDQTLRLAVLESASAPDSWRIWVNGHAVTPPIALAGSHGLLAPMAMGESWDGGRPACNRYDYRFTDVAIAGSPGGSWLPASNASVLQDPGYKVVKRAAASFDASAVQPLPATPQPAASPPSAGPQQVVSSTAHAGAPARPAVEQATPAPAVRVLSARAVSADAPLRKGFLPSPSLDAILGVTSPGPQPVVVQPAAAPVPDDSASTIVVVQPAEPDPGLGLGASTSTYVPGDQSQSQ